MKIKIDCRFSIKGFDNIVIDKDGQFWKLPYLDKRGRLRNPKMLKSFYHKNHVAVKINQEIYSENYLNSLRVPNNKKLIFDVKS